MKHEYSNKAPLVRLAFAVAALSVTLSIGGFIDFLATSDHTLVAGGRSGLMMAAARMR